MMENENEKALTAENARLRAEVAAHLAALAEARQNIVTLREQAGHQQEAGARLLDEVARLTDVWAGAQVEAARLRADVVTSWDKIGAMAAERNAETAKVDALARTVAACRQAMKAVVDDVTCDLAMGDHKALRTLLASPDVTIPADAWVSRAEHDRVIAESDARRRFSLSQTDTIRERDQTIAMLREQRTIDGEKIAALRECLTVARVSVAALVTMEEDSTGAFDDDVVALAAIDAALAKL